MAYNRSKKRTARKQAHFKKRLFVLLFLLICLSIALVFLLRASFGHVKTITIVGNNHVAELDIKQIIHEKISGSYLGIIPKKQIGLIDDQLIRDTLVSRYSEIQDVLITREGLTELVVNVDERTDTYIYCDEVCYSFDAKGYLFREPSAEELKKEFIKYTSKNNYKITEEFLSERILSELQVLLDSLEGKGLEITKVHELSAFTLQLFTNKGVKILIPRQDSYDEVYSTLIKLFATSEFTLDKENKDFQKDYVYINIQFGNKVFSCLMGDECTSNYK